MMGRRQHSEPRSCAWRVVSICLGSAVVSVASMCLADDLPASHPRLRDKGFAFLLKQFQVVQGSKEAAQDYYRTVVAGQMKFESEAAIETSTVGSLLTCFGYPNVNSRDLHALSSDALMALSADGDILATRFFAPKISDVQDKPVEIPDGGFGWRKLVRFKAKAGSLADTNDMQAVFILQNIFESTVSGDPFNVNKNVSKFNQAIAIRKTGTGPYNAEKRPAYFLTYARFVKVDSTGVPIQINGQFQDDGAISFSLNATFDEDDRVPETNSKAKEYFVPDSCVQCHGGVGTRAKLNFLDTDHWIDRVVPTYGLGDAKFNQEDFRTLGQSPFGVIYDGGKDTTTVQFKKALDTIRKLNQEIEQQNADVGGSNNFQLAAVTKWLELHATEVGHVPPYKRGFGASPVWDPQSENDRKLVYYLNRYCYRCHSSIPRCFSIAAMRSSA